MVVWWEVVGKAVEGVAEVGAELEFCENTGHGCGFGRWAGAIKAMGTVDW